jgi:hypothetical protein
VCAAAGWLRYLAGARPKLGQGGAVVELSKLNVNVDELARRQISLFVEPGTIRGGTVIKRGSDATSQ